MRHPLATALAAALAPAAHAHEFIDTRVTFTAGDDDFLHRSDAFELPSPTFGFGDRPQYQQFYENLNSRTSGRENQLELVVYHKLPSYFPRITTETAVALRLDMIALTSTVATGQKLVADDGTYIRIARDLSDGNAELVLFPLSTTRFRLGYLYALTWGDDSIFPTHVGPAPGLKLGVNKKHVRGFFGLKTATQYTVEPPVRQMTREELTVSHLETFYGVLGGLGGTIGEPGKGSIDIDVGGGWFQTGQNPTEDVRGERVDSAGVSGRIAYVQGIPVALSADLRLFRTDPEFLDGLNRQPSYPGGFAFNVSAEGNYIVQSLKDPDHSGSTMLQAAPAGALVFRAMQDYWRFNVTAMMRSIEFMFHTRPGWVPYQAFSSAANVKPELFGAVAVDRYFPEWHLTPGIQAGVQRPATLTTSLSSQTVGANPPDLDSGIQTLVIRADKSFTILPHGKDAFPIESLLGTLRLDLSPMTALLLRVNVTHDPNLVTLPVTQFGPRQRGLESNPWLFGTALVAQARF